MNHNTSTPYFLSLHGTEVQGANPIEWSPDSNFNQNQYQFTKVELSPSSPISIETRRVSTWSIGNNASSNSRSLSCIPSSVSLSSSSSSSSIETKTNDENSESGSITDEDDPIISLEALSLDTQRISLGVKTKGTRTGKTLFKGMSSQREKEQDRLEPPIESLNLASSINVVPVVHSSENSSALTVFFSQKEKQTQQQRITTRKKYTIRKNTNAIQNTSATKIEVSKAPGTKRQRGGSDFTMTSASDLGGSANNRCDRITSPSSPRKRRRVNRNRAMAAEDFDLILSQINTTGSL